MTLSRITNLFLARLLQFSFLWFPRRRMMRVPRVRVCIVWKYAADQRRYTRRTHPPSPVRGCSIFARWSSLFRLRASISTRIVSVTRAHASSCTQFVPFDGGTPRSTALDFFSSFSSFAPRDFLSSFLSFPRRFPGESRWNRRRYTNTRRTAISPMGALSLCLEIRG